MLLYTIRYYYIWSRYHHSLPGNIATESSDPKEPQDHEHLHDSLVHHEHDPDLHDEPLIMNVAVGVGTLGGGERRRETETLGKVQPSCGQRCVRCISWV